MTKYKVAGVHIFLKSNGGGLNLVTFTITIPIDFIYRV